jgi:uncharacterized membrane protein
MPSTNVDAELAPAPWVRQQSAGSVGGEQMTTCETAGRVLSGRRVLVSLATGLVAGGAVAAFAAPELATLVVWTVASTVLLAWVWRICWTRDQAGTKQLAEEENRSHSTDVWVLWGGATAGLAAVVVALVQSSGRRDVTAVAIVVLSVLAAVLSWALVNTVFAFKYARLYYFDEPDSTGIDFKQDVPPAYSDFAYLALSRDVLRRLRDRADRNAHEADSAHSCVAVIPVRDRGSSRRHQPRHQLGQ